MAWFVRAAATALVAAAGAAFGQIGTAFTYQCDLTESGLPANGMYDVTFRVLIVGGDQVGPALCVDNANVVDGKLTTILDFGPVLDGTPLELEISVRGDTGLGCSNPAGLVVLSPRQRLTPAPYAVRAIDSETARTATQADNADSLGGNGSTFFLTRANHTGPLPSSGLAGTYSSALALSNPANAFTGVGTGLTNLNAANISTGVLGILRGGTGANTSGAQVGQVLKFSGSAWTPGTDNDTTYTAGAGLLLTGTTFSIANQGIALGMLANDSVDTFAIAPGTIINSDISDNSITNNKLVNGTITNVKIAPNTITSALITDGTIGGVDMQASSIASINIVDGTIATADFASGAVTSTTVLDESLTASDLAAGSVGASEIADASVGTVELAANAVTTAKIAPDAVGNTRLASDAGSLLKVSGGALLSDGTRVGVAGAPNASYELAVNGKIQSLSGLDTSGSVTAAEFVHVTPFPRVCSVGPYDFAQVDGGMAFGESNGADHNGDPILYNTSLIVAVSGGAPVHLPDGAVVTGFEALVIDDSPSAMTVQLLRRAYDETAGGTMASVASTGAVASTVRSFTDSTISAPVIDNASYQYLVRVSIPGGGTPLNFKGAVIRYTVSRPLP